VEWETDLAKSAGQIGSERGDILYAQVAYAMRYFSASHNIFDDTKTLSWERIDRGWDAIERKFPDSLEAINAHVQMAGAAGDMDKARQCFVKANGRVTLSEWDAKGEFIDLANWVFTH
jgi:hypothetical protein